MRTHRFFVSVLATASMVAAGFMNAGLASANQQVAATADVGITCSTPPDDPDATTANRDRFVDLWSHRMADHAWLDSWIKLNQVPSDVQAEGFHSMSGQVQYWLDTCLLDDMLATAHETPTEAKRAQYMTGLNMVIFGKKGVNDLRKQLAKEDSDKPSPQKPVPSNLTPQHLEDMAQNLMAQPSLTSAD